MTNTARTPLLEIALLFLRLGTIAFGGPAAHIAMMRDEVVRKREWLTDEEFLDLMSACNLIPGPNSTELAIHIGHRQAGWAGLLVAGACFILPAFFIVLGVAAMYVRYATLPAVADFMAVIKPVIVAIIANAMLSLSKPALKRPSLGVIFGAVFIACFFVHNELALLFASGLLSLAWSWTRAGRAMGTAWGVGRVLLALAILATSCVVFGAKQTGINLAEHPTKADPQNLFFYFVRIGSVLYGSGYVLIAFLRSDLVTNWHWLTASQLIDATAVGQFTPGPVFTTATFIGYLLAGLPGAVLATVGIFLPAFVFVAVSAPYVSKLRSSPVMAAVLDGINAGSLALMAFVTITLARDALTNPFFIIEAVATFVFLRRGIRQK
jgi:chromate transporter